MSEVILTVTQAADYLKVCDKTVRRLVAKKEFKVSKVGKSWRIQQCNIDKYLIENTN